MSIPNAFENREPPNCESKSHVELGVVSEPVGLPLVSVIVRSMDRPMLHDALDSIASQTYGNVEVVALVDQGLLHADKQIAVADAQIDHLKPLLAALAPRIFAQAQSEQPAMMAYLNAVGLNDERKFAVVDVGYSATIQGRLNQLLGGKAHGYYMLTDSRAQAVAEKYGVGVQGCFGQYVVFGPDATALLRQSFDLEKLLSSDEAQIIRYNVTSVGDIVPEVRTLSPEEVQCQPIRTAIRKGALKFVEDAIATRTNLLGDYEVPTGLGRRLYEVLVERPSEREVALMRELVLDDYYCGRDLVN